MVRRNPDLIHEHPPHAVDALSQLDAMSRSIDGLKATVTRMAEATSTHHHPEPPASGREAARRGGRPRRDHREDPPPGPVTRLALADTWTHTNPPWREGNYPPSQKGTMNETLHTLDALINEIDQLLAWGDPSEADPVFQEGRDEGLREARKLIRARRESALKLSS